MNRYAIVAGAALALAGCNMVNEEDQLENSIRENLAQQGEVKQVELTKQDNDNMTGFALVRDRNGRDARMNCTARREESGSSRFNWTCLPTIDEATQTDMENAIRQSLSQQGEVLEVDMQRGGDDNHMTGFARVRATAGNEIRTECNAEREGTTSRFNWRCAPASRSGAAAASAAPPAAAAPPAPDAAPVDAGGKPGAEGEGGK
ncbi:MAG: hypothetical protein ACXWU1_11925 [Allosphingosinicella sp.]